LTAGLTIGELKPHHVRRWVDTVYKGTGDNYRRGGIRAIQRAFNWAVKDGLLEYSPIAKMEKPPATPRDVLISPAQWEQLIGALKARGARGEAFIDLLTIMRQTGCRPIEARTAEARHLDRKSKCLEFERHESKGHGSNRVVERRVVLLTDAAFALCERLAKKYPTGPLFRNSRGTAWKRHTIKEWFQRLDQRRYDRPSQKRVNFRLTAYAIRHTFATEALERGVDPVTLATIMGHKDVTMLMKVYQHLNRKTDHLRGALHRAIGLPAPATHSTASPA
jgi:integrase